MSDPVHRHVAFDLLALDGSYFKWPPDDPEIHRILRLLDVRLSQEPSHSQYGAFGERGQRSHKQQVANTFTANVKIIAQSSQEARAEAYETYLRPFNNAGVVKARYRPDGSDLVPNATNPVRCFDWDANTFNPQGGQANQDWDAQNQAPVDGSVEFVASLPTAPANPAAVAAAGPQITVSWDANTQEWSERAGLRTAGYRILRGTAAGVYTHQIVEDALGVVTAEPYDSATDDEPNTLTIGTESTSIVDDTVAALTQYFYAIQVIDYFNYISAASAEVDDTTP